MTQHTISFREKLPSGCPPHDANNPNGLTVYRLVASNPAKSSDFDSHKAIGLPFPGGTPECQSVSCSVFDSLKRLDEMMILPKPRARYHFAVSLVLNSKSGVVKGGKKGHYDWWICSGFMPEQHSYIVKAY